MEVTDKLIRDLALLSRLHFSDAEKESIKKELKQMIEFVDKLGEVDVEGIEPLMHLSDATNRLREDVVKGSVSREEALKNAPESDGIYFRVPKVINK
ncbi:MAG: Asp-tRNA(Asn)/Glu-tRNA(Gln) amidotransferase subunit GatC [Bacteroidota bacterium]|jgi:aspartyl-tRNA(Asn)/glutamyl-tRNA(Gln) amidotransferase subunit C